MINNIEAPILLIVFNRPEITKTVFDRIKKIKPQRLYIAADGPRSNVEGEREVCDATRKITEDIDWKCKVKRLYRKKNLGCGKAVSNAINWLFRSEEYGIIIEDDCLIEVSFYQFACSMISKYMDDRKVMHISGDNFYRAKLQNKNKYYLSMFPHVWGWATWKRAWEDYDYDMNTWKNKNLIQKIKYINGGFWDKLYWTAKFDSVAYKITNTWDYQWVFSVMKNSGLAVVPGVNLVSNIGFGGNSTHTSDANYYLSNLKSSTISENIKISSSMESNKLDKYERDRIFRVRSINTIIHFAYFSLFCMLYNTIYKR